MQWNWTVIAGIGQAVAAAAAVAGLIFVGWQISAARKTADLQALQEFVRGAAYHETRLSDAETGEKKTQAFFEFMNFLETIAAAINTGLFPRTTKKFAHQKLRDSLAVLQAEPQWHQHIEQAITSANTFEEIRIFIQRNKAEINRVAEARK